MENDPDGKADVYACRPVSMWNIHAWLCDKKARLCGPNEVDCAIVILQEVSHYKHLMHQGNGLACWLVHRSQHNHT